jgi:hypothetical protein
MSNNETAPCRGCGVLAPGAQWYEQHAAVMNGKVTMPGRFQRSTCPDCASLDFNRPGVAVRACLRLIGRPETDDALFAAVLLDEGFDAAEVLFPGGPPSHRPWSHAHDFRRDLRRLYAKALIRKVERATPREPVPPPLKRGDEADRCLICGRAEDLDWHGFVSLPLRGNGVARGCLCASDCGPVFAHIGAFGTQFIANAYLASKGEPVDLGLDRIAGLLPWYMLTDEQKQTVTGAWSWVVEPEPMAPIDPQGLTVEGLAAQVAQLQNELALLRGAQG